jgi:endonuclease III
MKDGTRYAGRFKRAYAKLKQAATIPEIPEWPDPIERLATAILGVECGDGPASRAVKKLSEVMVDWNEVRASYPFEVHRAIGNQIPRAQERCSDLIKALNAVYDREHVVSLDRLKTVGKRDARHYFDNLGGVNEYAAASVVLWSLGGHAMPVGDRVLAALRDADLVHPEASRADVQAFLERHVAADKAKETCLILDTLRSSPVGEKATRKRTARGSKRAKGSARTSAKKVTKKARAKR